jgi:hypothetical protein
MSIVNKKLSEDPQYMDDARCLYDEECLSVAKKILKKDVSNGRRKDRQVLSYEVVKSILIRLRQERQPAVDDFKKSHPDGGSQSIDKVLGVLLWDVVDQDCDDWEWNHDNNHSDCKIYSLKRN